ncbi:MAG: DUF2863 family protein [Betaproteobacteria bacterium]|nr:DUF2863 family protein [Betaproteobacteria bacterium]
MKRTRLPRRAKQTPDTEQLIKLATGLGLAGSRVEDAFWDARLSALVDRLLGDGDEATLTAALDQLYGGQGRAYDALADLVEARCESRAFLPATESSEGNPGKTFDMLLFVAPVLAWSRYSIPSGTVAAPLLANARVQLLAHVFAKHARVGLADFLFSPDQLPQSYCDTAALADRLGKSALHSRDLHLDPAQMSETANFLSDTRYLLGVAVAPRGAALFRWQEEDGDRNEALVQWRSQGGEALRPLLPGCASELLLPQAYHAGCRDADRHSRPYSLRASVAYLSTTLNLAPAGLRAVVAPFYDQQLEEYRIGFAPRNSSEVVHGVVWPLLDAEDDVADLAAQIETILREINVGEILVLDHRLPLEYCDDCGAPLYPNQDGEAVHAELPEEQADAIPRHLH